VNHSLANQNREVVGKPLNDEPLPGLPGAEQSGKKAYRCSLCHCDPAITCIYVRMAGLFNAEANVGDR